MQADKLELLIKSLMSGDENYLMAEVERKRGVITLPPEMSYDEGIKWLTVKRDADEKLVTVSERIAGFPLDVAHSLFLAIDQMFGFKEAKDQQTFFGPKPPAFIAVPIDHLGNTVDVLVGPFQLPQIEGQFQTQPDNSHALVLMGKCKQKHLKQVKALAKLTREVLKTNSLYRGKAIKLDSQVEQMGMVMPEFINTAAGYEKLILNRDILRLVEANVWNPIRYMERCIEYGTPVRRGVAFGGQYGTGKTLCANHTARIANENGWTFVYCKRPDDLIYAYDTARQWQPAVVFAEDIDRINPQMVHPLSTTLDGVDTKDTQILLILTSNHMSEVPPIIMRSGRIDMSIHFEVPDRDTIKQLVEFYATDVKSDRSLLDEGLDWLPVINVLDGLTPTAIREVIEQSKLAGISTVPLTLTTEDIVFTARGLKRHAALSALPVKEPTNAETLEMALRKAIAPGTSDQEHDLDAIYNLTDGVDDTVRDIHDTLGNISPADYGDDIERIKRTVDSIEGTVEAIRENQ